MLGDYRDRLDRKTECGWGTPGSGNLEPESC